MLQTLPAGQVSDESKQRELRKLNADLGPVVLAALDDPLTVEVVLNPDGRLWVERLGEPMREVGRMEAHQAVALLRGVAALLQTTITREKPRVNGELPDGSRFAGLIPPIVSAPAFAIRKRASAVFPLSDYVLKGILSAGQMEVLCDAVRDHRTILVSGSTGSGKTTLCNALIAELTRQYASERVLIIEDTTELQCSAVNCLQLRTSDEVNLSQLLRTSLRFRPDRILIGEVRGSEALDLLTALNMGHPGGVTTLHSNSAKLALSRFRMLVSMHPERPDPIEPLIAETEPIIAHIERAPGGRILREIVEVQGYGPDGYQLRQL
jgi:P-type conjugative transfer ATPase TrbB